MSDNSVRKLEEENKKLREKLQFYQEYDVLTGLYNKTAFYQKTARRLADCPDREFWIVCVDIERFKVINDRYGTERGDELLRYVAKELRRDFPPEAAILARLANDVFAMCVSDMDRTMVTKNIMRIFRNNPLDVSVRPAIGFCRVTEPGIQVSFLCDRAIIALKSIKGNYLEHSAVYDNSQRNALLQEQELLDSMDSALKNREFEIYFQPKCDMISGKIIGAEALVRWQHPQKGLIPPGSFIPAFEQNGFIRKLDLYVWEETAAWLRRRIDEGYRPLPVSINVSRIDICDMDVCKILQWLIEKYRLDHRLLELEITESAYASGPERIIKTTKTLMEQGFTVLMDDFGSGYSSLNILNDINVDILKMDMRFLERDSQKSKDILKSVVHMSKWLKLPVIAEGVEYQTQMDFLLGTGCTCAQGFFFYRPMPAKEFEALLRDEDSVDYEGMEKLRSKQAMLLDFQDFFHRDFLSEQLLQNLLGAVAIYSFDGTKLSVLQGTEEYYRITGQLTPDSDEDNWNKDVLSVVLPDDRPALLDALREAKMLRGPRSAKLYVRRLREGKTQWIHMRLFYLNQRGGDDIYYAALSDETQQMETMEQLRISETQFCLAMEVTNIVLFELDVKTREARYSEYAQKSFNLDSTVANAPEGFIEQGTVCEESIEDFRAVYDAIYRGEDKASSIVHARMNAGNTLWNRITLTALKDKEGETVKAVGMVETVCSDPQPTPEIRRELEWQAEQREGRKNHV